MYLEGGWKPRQEPPPSERRISDRDERVLLWLVLVATLTFMLAPIGGATIMQAFFAP